MRTSLLSLGLVVGTGAVLRFWNIAHGAPTPLEMRVITPVVQLLHTGSYRPPALVEPTLPVYLQALVATFHFMWGAVVGRWHSVSEFGPNEIVVWGRAVSALMGTAVVFIVYRIGMRWGARHALLGAGLMAVMPAHVAASREIGAASPLTLFAALALLLSIGAIDRSVRKSFIAAGAAAGFAAASHYSGGLAILMPLVAVWMTPRDDSSRVVRAIDVLGAAVAAFVVATPLALGDVPAFLDGFAAASAPNPAAAGGIDGEAAVRWLISSLQWPAVFLLLSGLTLGIVRAITGPGHTRWTVLVSFPVVAFVLIAWHGAASDTALLPLLPPSVLLAAIAVISGVSQLRRFEIPRPARTALIAALTVAALLPPAFLSVMQVRQASRDAIVAHR